MRGWMRARRTTSIVADVTTRRWSAKGSSVATASASGSEARMAFPRVASLDAVPHRGGVAQIEPERCRGRRDLVLVPPAAGVVPRHRAVRGARDRVVGAVRFLDEGDERCPRRKSEPRVGALPDAGDEPRDVPRPIQAFQQSTCSVGAVGAGGARTSASDSPTLSRQAGDRAVDARRVVPDERERHRGLVPYFGFPSIGSLPCEG